MNGLAHVVCSEHSGVGCFSSFSLLRFSLALLEDSFRKRSRKERGRAQQSGPRVFVVGKKKKPLLKTIAGKFTYHLVGWSETPKGKFVSKGKNGAIVQNRVFN
jgi:hypothetical protein